MCKKSTAYYIIIGAVELEEQQFSWMKRSECGFSGLFANNP